MYEMKGVSKPRKAMMKMLGGQMLCVGTYLAALIKGKTESKAFAYAMAVNGLAAAKFAFVEADDLNVPKAGPLAWRPSRRPRLQGAQLMACTRQ